MLINLASKTQFLRDRGEIYRGQRNSIALNLKKIQIPLVTFDTF